MCVCERESALNRNRVLLLRNAERASAGRKWAQQRPLPAPSWQAAMTPIPCFPATRSPSMPK